MSERKWEPDSWIQTYTGKKFWPLEPRPEDVCIEDIAHALALVNRFGGHTVRPYSVGQHSLLLSVHFELGSANAVLAKYALLHDAAEAYVGDMVRPLKRGLRVFRHIEDEVCDVIFKRFDLDPLIPVEVDIADQRILLTERNALMAAACDCCNEGRVPGLCIPQCATNRTPNWDRALAFNDVTETEPLDIEIANWNWQDVEARFLAQYHRLWDVPL